MKVLTLIIMTIILATIPILGCGNEVREGVPFSIQVSPQQIGGAYPGQAYKFLVTALSDETGKAVNISASITGAYLEVNPKAIKPGEVATITIIPGDTSVDQTLIMTIEGERDGLIEKETATIYMGSGS